MNNFLNYDTTGKRPDMSVAKDVVITMVEMELMYRRYNEGKAKESARLPQMTQSEVEHFNLLPEYKSVMEYAQKIMTDFATGSHGDVVLIDYVGLERVEIKRVKANYQEMNKYIHPQYQEKNITNDLKSRKNGVELKNILKK